MRVETFFKNFELLADAPNGVQRLRELILQLAVMGKLVPQDVNEEPASVLLEKIKAKRKQLIKEGKVSKSKPLPPIQLNEIPKYELPLGWHWCRFGQVIDCYRGHNPPKDKFVELPQEGYVRFIQITDFKTDEKAVYVPISKNLKYIYRGEIAMAAYRHIGKISRDVEGAFNVAICKVIEIPPMSLDFIEMLIGTDFVKGELLKASGRAHIPSMHTEHLLSLVIPLPPLAEQYRIVAKVDELMALCDRLCERQQKRRSTRIIINNATIGQLLTAREPEVFNKSWQHICNNFDLLYSTPDNIGKLRQAILQLAVQGKLVPQDDFDEPASVLLEKINLEKEKLGIKNKIKSSKKETVAEAFTIPSNWLWLTVDNFYDVCGGIQKTPKRTPISNFYPYLRVANVQRGRLDLLQLEYFELVEGELERWRLKIGDLLIVEGNGSENEIGRCAVWNGEIDNCVHQNHIIRARPIGHNSNFFTLLFLNSPSGMSQMRELAITTSGLYSLSVGKIREILVPLPPLAEQHRIVAKVKQLMTLCDKLETKLTQSLINSEKLMEAVVRQILAANSNKTDKHKSALLESISAEAAKPETKTAGRRNKKTQEQDAEAVQLNLPLF